MYHHRTYWVVQSHYTIYKDNAYFVMFAKKVNICFEIIPIPPE